MRVCGHLCGQTRKGLPVDGIGVSLTPRGGEEGKNYYAVIKKRPIENAQQLIFYCFFQLGVNIAIGSNELLA